MLYQPTEIDKAFDALLKACHLQGESGTEQLYYWLHDLLHEVDGVIDYSHEVEGLFIDMCSVMSYHLQARVDEAEILASGFGVEGMTT